MPRHGLGAENPINDRAQVVFVLVFLIVWGVDSFLLHFGLNLFGLISLFVSVPIGVISFIIGVYTVRKSEAVVFSNTSNSSQQKEAGMTSTNNSVTLALKISKPLYHKSEFFSITSWGGLEEHTYRRFLEPFQEAFSPARLNCLYRF